MSERAGNQRIVSCGSPDAGKKRVLDALARHVNALEPTVILGDGPPRVSWNAKFGRVGTVEFESIHGPGFSYDVAKLFAVPVSVVICALGQTSHYARLERS